MMSSPSALTHRVYGVSFSLANFCAKSSGTSASFPIPAAAASPGLFANWHTPAQIRVDALCVQFNRRIVFRRILELLEIVETARLEDAVHDRDEPHRLVGAGVEVLMDRVWRNVDDVPCFPFVALHLVLRLPVIRVGDLDIAVLLQVVALTFDDVQAFFGEVAMLARAAAR